jgi:hypothetical protein
MMLLHNLLCIAQSHSSISWISNFVTCCSRVPSSDILLQIDNDTCPFIYESCKKKTIDPDESIPFRTWHYNQIYVSWHEANRSDVGSDVGTHFNQPSMQRVVAAELSMFG